MREGVWHQLGYNSQRLVEEQLKKGAGVGVILSPRDLSFEGAVCYSAIYKDLGVEVLLDQQFYVSSFSNPLLESYPISEYRIKVADLHRIPENQFTNFAYGLEEINKKIKANAVLAPAVVYEANRPDIAELNRKLFNISKAVGDNLGIPTYATIVLGVSATASMKTINPVLSRATSINPDGWYFGFEFDEGRILSSQEGVGRLLSTGLKLACTGKPVLHAFAGPMSLLSFCFGALGAGIGHSQNLWQFSRNRFKPPTGQGGGGDAPARFFSSALWGTIIYPDELILLSGALQKTILTHSDFSINPSSGVPWDRWRANKHLVNIICSKIKYIINRDSIFRICKATIALLKNASKVQADIATEGVVVKDLANAYQDNWKIAIVSYLNREAVDLQYLVMLTT